MEPSNMYLFGSLPEAWEGSLLAWSGPEDSQVGQRDRRVTQQEISEDLASLLARL